MFDTVVLKVYGINKGGVHRWVYDQLIKEKNQHVVLSTSNDLRPITSTRIEKNVDGNEQVVYEQEEFSKPMQHLERQIYLSETSGKAMDVFRRASKYIPSSNYLLRFSFSPVFDYVKIEFSIPKYFYGTNIVQTVKNVNEKNFRKYCDIENSLYYQFDKGYNRLLHYLKQFFSIEFPAYEGHEIDFSWVEISRLDLCYNQLFDTKKQALDYLALQKTLKKKNIRKDSDPDKYDAGLAYNAEGIYYKIYHKGSEYYKTDAVEHQRINDKLYKQGKRPLFNIEYLQGFSDRMLRYEISFKKLYFDYTFNQNVFRRKSKVFKCLKDLYNKIKNIDQRLNYDEDKFYREYGVMRSDALLEKFSNKYNLVLFFPQKGRDHYISCLQLLGADLYNVDALSDDYLKKLIYRYNSKIFTVDRLEYDFVKKAVVNGEQMMWSANKELDIKILSNQYNDKKYMIQGMTVTEYFIQKYYGFNGLKEYHSSKSSVLSFKTFFRFYKDFDKLISTSRKHFLVLEDNRFQQYRSDNDSNLNLFDTHVHVEFSKDTWNYLAKKFIDFIEDMKIEQKSSFHTYLERIDEHNKKIKNKERTRTRTSKRSDSPINKSQMAFILAGLENYDLDYFRTHLKMSDSSYFDLKKRLAILGYDKHSKTFAEVNAKRCYTDYFNDTLENQYLIFTLSKIYDFS